MEKHSEDFGQTLGWWGMGTGPYLMLPLFGPSNFRDGPARVADAFTSPLFYVEDDAITYSLLGLNIIDTRADLFNAEEIVSDVSYDEYVTIRNAYLDNRKFKVYDGNVPEDDFFDEIEESEDGEESPATEPGAAPPDAAQPEAAPDGASMKPQCFPERCKAEPAS
jgi:ABC-type transporter lipoprotein component MlaA